MKEAILIGGPHHLKQLTVPDGKTRIVMLHNKNQTWYPSPTVMPPDLMQLNDVVYEYKGKRAEDGVLVFEVVQ